MKINKEIKKQIIRLWDAYLPMEQIYQMLPCKLQDAKRYVANLREDGTLKPRHRKDRSMQMVANAYNSGIVDIDELADMFSFTRLTIIEYLNKMGIKRQRPLRYKTNVGEKTHQIMHDLREAKISQTQIAKKYGVSRQYVHRLSNQI